MYEGQRPDAAFAKGINKPHWQQQATGNCLNFNRINLTAAGASPVTSVT